LSPVAALAPLKLGQYPTPVERLAALSSPTSTLWVKHDDLAAPDYGGNKVRKLERIIARAKANGAVRLVTIGAAGSHHVLATAHFAARVGLGVDAILVPQRRTDHVVENLRALVATGARIYPVRWQAMVPFVALRLALARDTFFVPLGGSSVDGAMGYFDATRELAAQIRLGDLAEPDAIVVTLGSGGTVAGIVAGLAAEKLRARVVAVAISHPVWYLAFAARRLARACARRAGVAIGSLDARLVVDGRYVGAGYGEPTTAGAHATAEAAASGLTLDATYTAKSFAATLDVVRSGEYRNVLYWHTLSSAPLAPLLVDAPNEADLPANLVRLLR
jgi:1-aminocyclopropane-1-carboxylate deaminase/D-cysteine desulfhydrase-like pyridoxal-dependent ACC family enzyme